jgi:hypothetical protein
MSEQSKTWLKMIIQAQIRTKIEQESKLVDFRKRALSQPEFKIPSVPEDFAPLRKRFKSTEVPKPKTVKTGNRKEPQKPKNEVTMKHDTIDDKVENKGDSYFELIEETTACKKISMQERGDAFVLSFVPGEKLVVMKFDNHVLPDEVCVTK